MAPGQQGLSADINVTPMIDVLLVLLVIFMLAVQLRSILPVNVPPPAREPGTRPAPQVVLELRADGSSVINGTAVSAGRLEARLRALTQGGKRQLLYVRAAPTRRYDEVMRAVDVAKGAGWRIIGYMP